MRFWNAKHEGLASPSNLLTAGLVALLVAGYATDWKVVFGKSGKPKPPSRFGASETAPHVRDLRMGRRLEQEASTNSEVADSRSP